MLCNKKGRGAYMTALLNITNNSTAFFLKTAFCVYFFIRFCWFIQNTTWLFGHCVKLLQPYNYKLKIHFPITIFSIFLCCFHENLLTDLSYVDYFSKETVLMIFLIAFSLNILLCSKEKSCQSWGLLFKRLCFHGCHLQTSWTVFVCRTVRNFIYVRPKLCHYNVIGGSVCDTAKCYFYIFK